MCSNHEEHDLAPWAGPGCFAWPPQATINGASERAIMKQTGHKSVAMVRRYVRDANLFRENAATRYLAMVGTGVKPRAVPVVESDVELEADGAKQRRVEEWRLPEDQDRSIFWLWRQHVMVARFHAGASRFNDRWLTPRQTQAAAKARCRMSGKKTHAV